MICSSDYGAYAFETLNGKELQSLRKMQSENPNLLREGVPDSATCWALVERVVDSPRLVRAARLRDLLLFVSRRSLKEGCDQVREHEIGTEVFGRPRGYDTNVDNIVRANVSELRKRIEAYFESEGARETLLMEIPRGNYVPAFRYRSVEHPIGAELKPKARSLPVEPPASILPLQTSARARRWILAGWFVCALIIVALACGCMALWRQNRSLQRSLSPWRYEPELKAFWGTFLESPLDTDIVLPDASFGQIQLLNDSPISLQDYLNHDYIGALQNKHQDPATQALLNVFTANSWVSPSAVRLSDSIQALDAVSKKIHIYLSEEYRPALLEEDNVILIGVPLANPWMGLYGDRLNFTQSMHFDKTFSIYDRAPKPGEQATYIHTASEDYCTIAYLPNSGHKGKILVIQGTNPPAYEAARFFLLSDDRLSNFRNLLHVTKLPYFEVLLKVSWISGTPLNATIVAYRTYPNLH
jgi:hypothetical protein